MVYRGAFSVGRVAPKTIWAGSGGDVAPFSYPIGTGGDLAMGASQKLDRFS
jgi:hypothetical protein